MSVSSAHARRSPRRWSARSYGRAGCVRGARRWRASCGVRCVVVGVALRDQRLRTELRANRADVVGAAPYGAVRGREGAPALEGSIMATLTASVYAWFEAYVGNRLLTVVEDGRRLARTDDGEWTVAVDGDELRVRIDREPYWSVEVYALAATGERTRAAALREINALNARLA